MEGKNVGPGLKSAILFRVFRSQVLQNYFRVQFVLFLFALSFELIQDICRNKRPVNVSFVKIKSW